LTAAFIVVLPADGILFKFKRSWARAEILVSAYPKTPIFGFTQVISKKGDFFK